MPSYSRADPIELVDHLAGLDIAEKQPFLQELNYPFTPDYSHYNEWSYSPQAVTASSLPSGGE